MEENALEDVGVKPPVIDVGKRGYLRRCIDCLNVFIIVPPDLWKVSPVP